MIGRLRGTLIEKQPPQILIDVNGVGYEVAMPMTCFYELPENGNEVTVLTHFVVREDAQLLYGFNSHHERALFKELIKVNGVGPKLALAILSGMSASQFISAVDKEEINTLIKLPGVGKKTAERLIVEMKDRIKNIPMGTAENPVEAQMERELLSKETLSDQVENEAISALVALGYKPQEATKIINKVSAPDMSSEALIKAALKSAL